MIPLEGVYLVNPLFMDSIAASIIFCGVLKSGSPAPKPITSIPSCFICFALAVIASVGDGATPLTRFDNGKSILFPPPI